MRIKKSRKHECIAFINSTVNKQLSSCVETRYKQFFSCGEANGYVAVPPEHPFYGYDYDELNVDVHGGLTAAGTLKAYSMDDVEIISGSDSIPHDWWIFGFDTMHFLDNRSTWPKSRVIAETLRLKIQLDALL